jgi:hypothetical protein
MEQHKNYQEILTKHRSQRKKSIVRLVLYIVAFLILMLFMLFGLEKIWPESAKHEPENTSEVQLDQPPNVSEYGTSESPNAGNSC